MERIVKICTLTPFDMDGSAGAAAFSIGHDNLEVNAAIASQLAQVGDYLGRRTARRFAGTPLRCLVTGFVVSAA
jgi:hypothetical protein